MNIKKLYYWLVSLISVIAMAISLWIIVSNLLKFWLISDQEYLVVHSYELSTCKYDLQRKYCSNLDYKNYNACVKNLENNEEYKKDLKTCEENKKQEILLKRNYNLKISLIWSISTFIIFLILFLYHYPKFKKEN